MTRLLLCTLAIWSLLFWWQSDYPEQLIVTPEMLVKNIKTTKGNITALIQ